MSTKRHGTVSLLAGIELLSGEVLGLVRERHRSAEFIEFLQFGGSTLWRRDFAFSSFWIIIPLTFQTDASVLSECAEPLRIHLTPKPRLVAESD